MLIPLAQWALKHNLTYLQVFHRVRAGTFKEPLQRVGNRWYVRMPDTAEANGDDAEAIRQYISHHSLRLLAETLGVSYLRLHRFRKGHVKSLRPELMNELRRLRDEGF